MKVDPELRLDELLSEWHAWARPDTLERGFNRRALVCGDYRVSRQYDDTNGALDVALSSRQSAAVNFAVQHMLDPWRAAIGELARNLYTGHEVWRSPRLPSEPTELAVVVKTARKMLIFKLTDAGLM